MFSMSLNALILMKKNLAGARKGKKKRLLLLFLMQLDSFLIRILLRELLGDRIKIKRVKLPKKSASRANGEERGGAGENAQKHKMMKYVQMYNGRTLQKKKIHCAKHIFFLLFFASSNQPNDATNQMQRGRSELREDDFLFFFYSINVASLASPTPQSPQ